MTDATVHLAKAKEYIGRGEDYYRRAAEEIVAAMKEDPTLGYRQIAKTLGKGTTWVGDIVRWHTNGRAHDGFQPTPFAGKEEWETRKVREAQNLLRDANPEQLAELLGTQEVRVNLSKALDTHYAEESKTIAKREHEEEVARVGGEEELEAAKRRRRIADVVSVLRGVITGLRFAAAEAKALGLDQDSCGAEEELRSSLEEILGFVSLLREFFGGREITDEDIAALIGDQS